ncbi:hypothetical protein, variant [Blastomyces dermatitidis ATCC 26199]|nr:hypothetical protein BDFG_07677 [Blastomyces dermatitidis ATCC 26199]EQL29736.1 hypothetical protein, variant [Blastomyces dermatitidis ATCC 26199]
MAKMPADDSVAGSGMSAGMNVVQGTTVHIYKTEPNVLKSITTDRTITAENNTYITWIPRLLDFPPISRNSIAHEFTAGKFAPESFAK